MRSVRIAQISLALALLGAAPAPAQMTTQTHSTQTLPPELLIRERRQGEVQKEQEKISAEHEAYFDSIIQSSQASLQAPQGVYYRKPGFVSTDPPGNAARVAVDGIFFLYEQGIFWLQQGTKYIVVPAPFGAVVDRIPEATNLLPAGTDVLHYYFGTFFSPKDGKYTVVRPPAGSVVSYLPDGYHQETAKGAGTYKFGAINFKAINSHGLLSFQVVEP